MPIIIQLSNIDVKLQSKPVLSDISLQIEDNQRWVIMGPNGSGKSTLAKILSKQLSISAGSVQLPDHSELISFEKVSEILDYERYRDDSNLTGGFDQGTSVDEFLFEQDRFSASHREQLLTRFNLKSLLQRGIKFLSTGEMRKVTICKALINKPHLIILDEPFEGLDSKTRPLLYPLLDEIVASGTQLVLILNRRNEIPPGTTHIAQLNQGRIQRCGSVDSIDNATKKKEQIKVSASGPALPDAPRSTREATSSPPALIEMREVTVRYGDKTILNNFNWTVEENQHWMVSGPNGSGKSTLINLITGDNTQAYANDIRLFGQRKGSGESIWEIKKRLGHISTALQRDYRVGGSVLSVVLSGLFDSIGVYRKQTPDQTELAQDWLTTLKMTQFANKPFNTLSFGQKRLVLLARAMIKRPQLLLLDEPCQGLDDDNRRHFLDICQLIGTSGSTQLIYVTHRPEDDIPCIDHHLQLIPAGNGFTSLTTAL